MIIKDLLEGFIRDCKCDRLAESTINEHFKMFTKVLLPSIGHIDLLALLPIHKNDIIEYANKFGRSTPRHAIITFRRLLHYVKKCRIPIGVEAEEIEIPIYRSLKDVCAWTREEIAEIRVLLAREYTHQFSKHADDKQKMAHLHATKRTEALFELLIHSGLRLSEALSIDKENMNWEKRELRVEDCKEEEGTWKTVYFHGAEKAIEEYLAIRTDIDPALFVSSKKGTRLKRNSAQTTLKRIKKRATSNSKLVRGLNHKTCRSTFITIPLLAGIDPKTVQELAHHKSLQTTLEYYFKIIQESLNPTHAEIFASL